MSAKFACKSMYMGKTNNGSSKLIYLVNCVKMAPRHIPKNPPIGAPAAKVANPIERSLPVLRGNALARIPS